MDNCCSRGNHRIISDGDISYDDRTSTNLHAVPNGRLAPVFFKSYRYLMVDPAFISNRLCA